MFDENLSKNVKSLAYEKSIDVERVFKALEDALATAARKYYKTREPMETVIDRVSGGMTMYVIKDVVVDENEIEDPQVLQSPQWAEAVERGRWPSEVRPHTSNRQHLLFKVQ